MTNYNPRAPQVLGEEWVPIRDEDVTISPAINVVELGHTFTLATSRTVRDGRFYVDELPQSPSDNQVSMMAVYRRGTEDETGPIRRVVIPVNSAPVTGTGIATGTTDAQRVLSLANPSDGLGILAQPYTAAGAKTIQYFFNTSAYSQMLQGKRIVAVNLLFTMSWEPNEAGTTFVSPKDVVYSGAGGFSQSMAIQTGAGSITQISLLPFRGTYGNSLLYIPGLIEGELGDGAEIIRFPLGEVNPLWSSTPLVATQDRMPWRYAELARFEPSAGVNRTWITMKFGDTNNLGVYTGDITVGYMAMEVLFCEETRVAYGGHARNVLPVDNYSLGQNICTLRDTTFTADPVLPAGDYTVVLSMPDIGNTPGPITAVGQKYAKDNGYPQLNGVRQLEALPGLVGLQVNVTQTEGEVFTVEETEVLPQLSLHGTTSAPLTEVHPYGRLARAQVYGTITATQDIDTTVMSITGSYPQVRYYARRFGDTTVPLRLARTTDATVFCIITPTDFDELEEIVDGWKEVTLRLTASASMFAAPGSVNFTWSALTELAGNRWEVLGGMAPAISGTPGNYLGLAPAAAQLGAATYGGTTVNADWMPQYAPPVSGTAADTTTDLVLILSQDPGTITGLAVSGMTQPLTTYTECSRTPCCVPSALAYNRVTWGAAGAGPLIVDTASREVSGGLGTTDTDQTYTLNGGTAVDYGVTDGQIVIQLPDNADRYATVNGPTFTTFDLYADVASPVTLTDGITASFETRFDVALQNGYRFRVFFDDDGTVDLFLQRITGGAATSLATQSSALPSFMGLQPIHVRAQGIGSTLQMKIWTGDTEPVAWNLTTTDATYTSGVIGIRAQKAAANTNLPAYVTFDNLTVSAFIDNLTLTTFGYYELQRMDTVENVWQTIMQATTLGRISFNDYEARVGVLSSYRIRVVNALGFAGQWSAVASRTITEPGVTLPSCGTSKRGVLIFTTNEVQNGSSNLAYAMVWDDSPVEDFSLIEASTVQISPFFDRDYQVAFHGTERGGEAFSRDLLLANAAVANPRLANGTSLRDLAWEDLPYVCVRDDIGDRWLSTIIVPSINVRRNRRLYNASITIIQVTNTPSPVDP